jgi:hypothetical protein
VRDGATMGRDDTARSSIDPCDPSVRPRDGPTLAHADDAAHLLEAGLVGEQEQPITIEQRRRPARHDELLIPADEREREARPGDLQESAREDASVKTG